MLRELAFRMSVWMFALAVFGAVEALRSANAGDASQVGVVGHVKVLSDKVPDVSSMEAWKKSFIRDGMSDRLATQNKEFRERRKRLPPVKAAYAHTAGSEDARVHTMGMST